MSADRDVHLSDDRCLDLVHDLLPAEEAEHWLAHVRECPECEERLRRAGADLESMRVRLAESPGIAGRARDDRDARGPKRIEGTRRRRLRLVVLIPAAAALLAVTYLAIRAPHPRGATEMRWIEVDPRMVTLRGGDSAAIDPRFQRGIDAYRRRAAAAATRLLAASRVGEGYDDLRRLYLASAWVAVGDDHTALETIRQLEPATLPPPWRDEAAWVELQALEGLGRHAEADSLRGVLATHPGEIGDLARKTAK